MRLYAIYDKLAQESGPIFEAKNDKVALRMIKNQFAELNQEEYRLLYLGEYDHDPVAIRPVRFPEEVLGSVTAHVEDEVKKNMEVES